MATRTRWGWWTLATGLVLCATAAPAWAVDSDGDGVDDAIDVCNNTPLGVVVNVEGRPLGDIDLDCDVDLDDLAMFQANITGPLARSGVAIETVTVGNPGNGNDTYGEGYGGVDYTYNIGKYEVTAGQYNAFLNAVAATDTYGLYNTLMWANSDGCKIERAGFAGSYTYSVAPDWAERPVNYVSWSDAVRFANWLHNGQPTGAQDLTTTEDGSYYLNGATSTAALMAVDREPDATWVIPSEDEWYKAAYHKNDGVTGNYWAYPTSTNAVPSNNLVDPDPGNNATFDDGGGPAVRPYFRTTAGAHENSSSPYGTFDQGGNVWEWNEATVPVSPPILSLRISRGGSFNSLVSMLHASIRGSIDLSVETGSFGFRVAEIP